MENIEVITDESNVSVYKKDITTFVEQKHIDTATISGSDNTVSVIKKEYKLVGDDVYIGKTYEDAPQWIRDFINNVVDFSIGQKITELNSVTVSLNSLIEELNIAKNTYTNSIISSADIDERINTAITTLNSSINNSNANIVGILNTKATPDQASALSAEVLESSINSNDLGSIGSIVSGLQTSITNNTQTLANNIDTVYSEMTGEFDATAQVIDIINTSITNIDNTLTSQANSITNISTELNSGANTWASADSTLENSLMTEITDEGARVESKFAYNSNVNINGIWKKSGFGLTTNYTSGTGTEADPYISEFWIDASRFKFTNSNQTGSTAPFTIDATGVAPQITFNGKVSFSNVTDGQSTVDSAITSIAEAIPAVGNDYSMVRYDNLRRLFKLTKYTNYGVATVTFKAHKCDASSSYKIVIPMYSSTSDGFLYLGVSEYDGTLSNGKTHVGDSTLYAGAVYPVEIVNGTRFVPASGYNGSAMQSGYKTITFDYKPTLSAKYFSVFIRVSSGTDYVYAGIPSIETDVTSNNNSFAQSQGFLSYSDMVSKYSSLGKTIISGGYINTGLVTANSILAYSVSADRLMAGTNSSTVWSGGGLVSENFNGNPYGDIGAPTQGFRLSSGAAGTETDPNIYGAYIKGSTVDIETLSVKAIGYSGNSGRVVKYQKNGYIYMPGYGSGFLASRVCSQSESAVKIEGWYRAATNYLVAYLQYSTDGVNWINLAVKDAQQYGFQEYFYIYFAELFNPSLVTATDQVTFRIIGNVGGNASDILISIYNN